MGRTLKSHDWVFWCGDFNYRVDLDREELISALRSEDLSFVLQYDQLRKEQEAGNVFSDFLEGEIAFEPTYKYDVFSDEYDTSEKQRIPAWTDRVLWRHRKALAETDFVGAEWNPGELIHYGRSELKQSDHRPVIAIVVAEIMEIDHQSRQKVFKDVIRDLGPPDSTIIVHVQESSDDQENLSIYDEEIMSTLIQKLSQMGEITLVRYVKDTMWITFRDGESALNAASKGHINIFNMHLRFELKSPHWYEDVEKEIQLCTANTIPLCANPRQQAELINSIPEIPQRNKHPTLRTAPARPPMPMSPKNLRQVPHAAVISVVPEMLQQVKVGGELRVLTPAPAAALNTSNHFKGLPLDKTNENLSSEKEVEMPIKPARPLPPTKINLGNTNCEGEGQVYEESNIYEEIKEESPILRCPPSHPPPICPDIDVSTANANALPQQPRPQPLGAPPPLPTRRVPPPIPNRSGPVPALPQRPSQ